MVYVCLDEKMRFGRETWAVYIMEEDDEVWGTPLPEGLFWEKDNAVLFAEALDKTLYETE